MQRLLLYKHRLISGGVTLLVAIFSVLIIFFYDWTAPAKPIFLTQAIDCTQGFLCDRDGVCDSPCETADTCPVDCRICGNGVCEPGENNANCNSDCPNTANCGNRYCETGEDYLSCASDCALCERQSTEYIYQAGCSDYNIQNGYNIDLANICACGNSCPIGTTGNFSCPYVGLFFQTEDGSCDNGIDDDDDGMVDCDDSDCVADLACLGGSNGGLSLIQARDNDDINSPVSTLADALGGKDYLVVGYVETLCGPCHTFGTNLNANTDLQQIFSQSACNFIAITDPSIYNGIFSSWTDVVGSNSFVGQRSKELVSRDMFMSTYSPTGSPQAFLLDANGAAISSNIIATNNSAGLTFNQAFYDACAPGGSTNGGSTTGGPSGSDNNNDGIDDSEQTDYVQTIPSNNATTTTLTATGTNIVITDLSLGSNGSLSGARWYPVGVIDFSLTSPENESVDISLIFENVTYQPDLLLYKHNGTVWEVVNSATIVQQGSSVVVTYTLTDNGTLDINPLSGIIDDPIVLGCPDPDSNQVCGGTTGSAEICTGGIDEDLDGFIDCADSDCSTDSACVGGGGGTGGSGTGSAEICTGGIDEDLDGFIDCADSDCSTDSACVGGGGGTGGSGTGSAEICTGGIDEDLDGFIDCADSSCFGTGSCCSNGILDGDETGVDCGGSCAQICVGTGSNSCQDGLLNGTETDIDCGGSCPVCATGKRCMLDADCASSTCVYGVLGDEPFSTSTRVLQGGMSTITLPVVTSSQQSDPSWEWYENRLLIKFKKENNLLLPTYADDMLLNSEERYLGYLVGKVATLYEQQGVAPLMMVRAVDQLFDFDITRIDQVYALDASATASSADELAQIYRVIFDQNTDLDALVAQLQRNIAVEFIEKEPLYKVTYTDPQAVQQWHLSKIEADKARYAGASGNASVVVAVIDNGFDLAHSDLQGALVAGRDVADNDADPSLPNSWLNHQYGSHGTHTIGIVGAVTNNALGVASIGGGVRVMPIKATSDVYEPIYVTHAYQALQYAVSRSEVDVISMSFGGPPSSTLEALIQAHPEKIFVAAGGNDNVQTPQYPAAYAAVVSVAATNSFDDKAVFSNYGSWIDISAPGVTILSTAPNNTYVYHDGTSMATPMVASLLGLLLSLGDTNPVQTLEQTADPLPTSTFFTNNLLGAGRINVCNAVATLGIPCVSSVGGGTGSTTGGSGTGSTSTGGGKGICLLLGSTGTGSTTGQTGTGSSGTGGSTTGQTGTGGSSTTGQQYPAGSIQISSNTSTTSFGDTVLWTMSRTYTTYGPNYPTATLDLFVDLPFGLTYMTGSYSVAGDGTFLGYDEDGGDIVFVVKIAGLPSSSSSTSKTYEGTIRFRTNVTSSSSSISTNVVSSMQCYDLNNLTYIGSSTCSTSSNRQSGIEIDSDSQKITLNQTSAGTTTNTSTSAGTTNGSSSGTGGVVICGDGVVQGSEQCDDGNRLAGDGCSAACSIEQGWRCITTSPSQCGSDDCFTHGETFSETNIFGVCCGGLSEIVISPTSAVVTGVVRSHICYDPLIGQPVCDTRASPSGWRIPTETASGTRLVLKDSCRSIYKDYYNELISQLQGMQTQCIFADIPYDQVVFQDIRSTKQRVAIQTLRDACVVQGIDQNLDTFGPNRPIQRAELIKMVVKLLMIAQGDSQAQEIGVYSGGIQFFDVPPTFWGAWYIEEAMRRGLLSARSNQGLMTFFKPYASVSHEEFIALIRRLEVGQMFSRSEIETVIGKRAVVSRAAAAELLVKKFLVHLQPYFYFKGDQEEYYRRLAEELRGKNYQQQYSIILSQIDKLQQQDEHGSPEGWDTNNMNPYWMQQFLRQFIY